MTKTSDKTDQLIEFILNHRVRPDVSVDSHTFPGDPDNPRTARKLTKRLAGGTTRQDHCIIKPDAVMAIVYDPKKDVFLMVLQERTLRTKDNDPDSLEFPGGRMKTNEKPLDTAVRESVVELGMLPEAVLAARELITVRPLEWISEKTHVQLILVDPDKVNPGTHFGNVDKGEFTERMIISRAVMRDLIGRYMRGDKQASKLLFHGTTAMLMAQVTGKDDYFSLRAIRAEYRGKAGAKFQPGSKPAP